tara:strand:- start:1440 stop:1991 length:552 start_codon:yes stop_codon:yes gene_type:complete
MEIVKQITQHRLVKNLFIVLIGTVCLAISSKVKIPFYPVPMTMQTLVVLVIGVALGWKLAVATIALYLFEGIIGLPVFSGTPEKGIGLVYFIGPTMGYLIGFLAAAFIAGKFKYNNNIISNFLKLLLSVSTIYLFGLIWLGQLIGWDKPLFKLGAEPFLLAELFKILLVTFSINQIKKINKIL